MKSIENTTIVAIRREAGGLVDTAHELVVMNDQSALNANEVLVFVSGSVKKLEAQRVFLVKPLNDHVKAINLKFKEWVLPLETANSIVRRKLLDFQRARLEAARLEDARLEAERLAALPDDLEDLEDLPVLPVRPAPSRTIEGSSGTTSVRKTWTFEVTDEAKVPREYLLIDEGVIAGAVRKGVRDISGVRIYQQESLSVRAR